MGKNTSHKSDQAWGNCSRKVDGWRPPTPPHVSNLFKFPIDFFDLLDEIAIGVAVMGPDRHIVAMNQTLKAITGFNQEELSGVVCCHILRSNVCFQNCPALALNEKSGSKCQEGNLINKDRQIVPVRITAAPLKSTDGEIIGILETVEDISLLRKLDETASHTYKFNNIIGRSPEMEKIFQILPSLAQTDSSILITGETGTGKDLMAKEIHQSSSRAKGPFVKVNCGALPETLLESELFGHSKGAFTGAVHDKPGRFRMAHNGTLYLTEIGDLSLALQVKLLTFLDDREVFPLGSVKPVSADVRIIAATHRNLEQRVIDNRFRKDLLFRLNVIRLHLPPLRKRHGDIQLLADHFLNSLSIQLSKKKPALSSGALKCLMSYNYSGNVRELRNIVEYAINICDEEVIRRKHLPFFLLQAGRPDEKAGPPVSPLQPVQQPVQGGSPDKGSCMEWAEVERQMIIEALIRSSGRKNKGGFCPGLGQKHALEKNETIWDQLTMSTKILIPLYENDVAPRFDLATEVLIVTYDGKAGLNGKRTVVLPRASADQLCHLILTENVQTVICSGIEDDYYKYLKWKKVEMIDSVIGSSESALKRFVEGSLKAGDILYPG